MSRWKVAGFVVCLVLSGCTADPDLGEPLSVAAGDLDCDLIEAAVVEVYDDVFALRPVRSTYAQEYTPSAIGDGEQWCEFDPTGGGVDTGEPGATIVVATDPIDESTGDAIARIASVTFADGTVSLSLTGLDTHELPVEGTVEIPRDSPGSYGATGRRLVDGVVYVVVTGSGDGREVTHGQLAHELAEAILAGIDR